MRRRPRLDTTHCAVSEQAPCAWLMPGLGIGLSLPALPVRLNTLLRAHWSKRHAEQQRWNDMVAIARLMLPKSQRACIDPAVVTLTFVSPRRRDPDGLAKCVLDALVKSGLIADDGPPHLVELRLISDTGPAETGVLITSSLKREEGQR